MNGREGVLSYGKSVVSTRCYYCGADKASDLDHVVPIVWASTLPPTFEAGMTKVPCCRHCNAIAGGMAFDSVGEKAQWIAWRLRHKNKLPDGDLGDVVWLDNSDLDDLGSTLRGQVLGKRQAKNEAIRRVVHLELLAADDALGKVELA